MIEVRQLGARYRPLARTLVETIQGRFSWPMPDDAQNIPAARRAPPRPRRLLALSALGVILVAGLAYGIYLWLHWGTHVSTDDAFIAGHISSVSTRISGTVVQVLVNDNQDVKSGDPLVRLDPRDYEVALAQARAAVEAAKADLENAVVNVPLADETTRSLVQGADQMRPRSPPLW